MNELDRAARRAGRTLLLLALPALVLAAVTFERRWHWFREDIGHSVALTADGGYLVGGESWVDSTQYGIVLARTDSLGDTTSVRHVLNVDHGSGYLCGLHGGDFVAGGTKNGFYVFAQGLNPSGDSIWSYDPSLRGRVYALAAASDGGCLITGRIPDSMYDMGVIKLDSAGNEEWNRCYDDPRIMGSTAFDVVETQSGGLILCGDANDYMGSYVRLVRTDATGDTLWTRLISGPVGPSLRAIRETPDRGFLAVGTEFDTSQSQNAVYLVRTDSNGAVVWTRNISPLGAGTLATALCTTTDGGYLIAGRIDWGDSARAWLVKLDAGADTVWTNVLPGIGREQAEDVWQTADGGYVVAGTSDSAGGSFLLIKTDSLGEVMTGVLEGELPARVRIGLSVSPNPASGVALVNYSPPGRSAAALKLYDVAGYQVGSWVGLRTPGFRIDVGSFPAGVYLLRLESDSGSATRKLVIE
jgi:hypothetical protein